MLSMKETLAVVTSIIGDRWAKRFAVVLMMGAVCTALLAIGSFLFYLNSMVVQPTLGMLRPFQEDGTFANAAVALVVSGIVVTIVAVVAVRIQSRRDNQWKTTLLDSLLEMIDEDAKKRPSEEDVNSLRSRIENLETVTKDLASRALLSKPSAQTAGTAISFAKTMSPPELPSSSLAIRSARYGYGDRWQDVTAHLATKVKNGRIEMPVLNDTLGGDPFPHQRKELHVTYEWNGKIKPQLIIEEKSVLKLPQSTDS